MGNMILELVRTSMASCNIFFLLFLSFLASSVLQLLRHNTFPTLPIYTRVAPRATLQMATPSNPISRPYSPPYQITSLTIMDFTKTQSLDKTPGTLSLDFSCVGMTSFLSFVNNVSKMQPSNYPHIAR